MAHEAVGFGPFFASVKAVIDQNLCHFHMFFGDLVFSFFVRSKAFVGVASRAGHAQLPRNHHHLNSNSLISFAQSFCAFELGWLDFVAVIRVFGSILCRWRSGAGGLDENAG